MPPRASGTASASRGRGRGGAAANKSTSTARGATTTASSAPRRAASRGRGGGTSRGGRKRPQPQQEDEGEDEEEQPGVVDLEDGDVPMQGGDRGWDGGVDGFGVPPVSVSDGEGGGDDEEEEGREKIPPELLTRILHAFFERDGTRITRDANAAVARYMDIFVREAIARAAVERSGGFLEVEDLEKIAPQLLMDL
ncbi:CENP-S associating centromere protein X-domain-containing protein [Chaetomium tenue]|uniref:CENP-S associating centromere protein X-domain-containing protein n=1 Tax=Chaetomium tenue TaxID=1854479 RepID=A0ACB7NWY1_9PEZI|nr:CENP-S associating centromere protein X-domain-containing protein [Chaetomium globosum]